jgi:hypothetical protein
MWIQRLLGHIIFFSECSMCLSDWNHKSHWFFLAICAHASMTNFSTCRLQSRAEETDPDQVEASVHCSNYKSTALLR